MSAVVFLQVAEVEQTERLRRAEAERRVRAAERGSARPSVWKSLLLTLGLG